VPDGAYLYTDKYLDENFEKDISYERMSHLLKRIDIGAQAGYNEFKNNNDLLKIQSIMLMSNIKEKILRSIDYEFVKYKRKNNYKVLNKIFIAKYWENVLNYCKTDSVEYILTENLISIPTGAPIFSVLIPAVQKFDINGTQFKKGVITGYECAIRFARALQPALINKGFHATGICGTIGAAMAVGIALNFSKKQLKDTLSAVVTCTAGLFKMLMDKSEFKPYNVGNAAQNAINSVPLVKSGFEGPNDVLGGEKGFLSIYSDKYKTNDLLSPPPLILSIYIKPYAVCRHCHAPIEAAIVEIITIDGGVYYERIDFPKGEPENQMSFTDRCR